MGSLKEAGRQMEDVLSFAFDKFATMTNLPVIG